MTRDEEIELAYRIHQAQRTSTLTPLLRERLSEAQNWRCCYCHVRMMGRGTDDDSPTFEHIVPRWNGGNDDLDNIAISCKRCNNALKNTRPSQNQKYSIVHR